jgi:hypothetical protein
LAVRPEGADHLWRKNPPRESSTGLVADERARPQPGDPAKAALVDLRVVRMDGPTFTGLNSNLKLHRIILGSDAYKIIGSRLDALQVEYKASKNLAYSTDFQE